MKRQSKMARLSNGKKKRKKGTKHFQQNTTQKTKDRGTQTKMGTQTFCL